MLRRLLARAASTEVGNRYGFTDILRENDPAKAFAQRVPCIDYETMRGDVWRMIKGGRDIPLAGQVPVVCSILRNIRRQIEIHTNNGRQPAPQPLPWRGRLREPLHSGQSCDRIFAGKGMILGGSFANEIPRPAQRGACRRPERDADKKRITPLADLVRVPEKRIALMPDWEMKLPALAQAALNNNVTNISGVPSWFLTVIKHILSLKEPEASAVWPNLEVFFHGGIAFGPYREEYRRLTEGCDMHFMETYNASEGFFATQNDLADPAMLLIIDCGIYYEFIDVSRPDSPPAGIADVEKGKSTNSSSPPPTDSGVTASATR